VAVYEQSSGQFRIDTPNDMAQKFWIGDASRDAHYVVVFAQLKVKGKDCGVHALIVPVRDPVTQKTLPGVTIEDCGVKGGLNGVDNGRIWFDNVLVPRENLLDRFGKVDSLGNYSSSLKTNSARFAKTMSTLSTGRVGLCLGGSAVAKVCLYIVTKYSLSRIQFDKTLLLDRPGHQQALFPLIAKTYAISFANEVLRKLYLGVHSGGYSLAKQNKLHLLVSGLKVYTSEHAFDTSTVAIDRCGGQGFSSKNLMVEMSNDVRVYKIFEGANPVLLQQVAGGLIKKLNKKGEEELDESRVRKYLEVLKDRFSYSRDPITRVKRHRAKPMGKLLFRLRAAKNRKDFTKIWDDSHKLVTEIGWYHVELTVMKAFQAAIGATSDPADKELLQLLFDIHAGTVLGDDIDAKPFLGGDSIADKCKALRPNAERLVNEFNVPSWVKAVPLAMSREERVTFFGKPKSENSQEEHSTPDAKPLLAARL